ncbi:MAG: ABC transporter family substrate-binding protein [Rhodococcus sp. (in: high G+C Gram-positive bacteria)]|uniref:ABC transporter family substrate-binding protein n=1 Tax=Rhodococcus sp. TaxID=1831 RepID=UPI003BB522E0
MTIRTELRPLLAGLLALPVLLAGCTSAVSHESHPVESGGQEINAQPVDSLAGSGELRIPVDALPTNFNPLQLNGARVVTWQLAEAILPSAFRDGADGAHERAADFFSSVELTSSDPQTVTYDIADGAQWSNGRALDWEDLAAQVLALGGDDPAYEGYSNVGYDAVGSVERGASDQQAVVTFDEPFAEWQGLFNLIVPKEVSTNAETFNSGWLSGPTITAGPFTVSEIDQTAKTVVVERNDDWWGERPALDRIVFRALDSSARADALANNEIDLYPIGADIDLFTRAQGISGVEIRQAPERKAGQLTFNGGDGRLLADEQLRRAIAQSVDPTTVSEVLLGQIVPGATPPGNHILPPTDAGWRDNSSALPFDSEAAEATLDELGWIASGDGTRSKDGTPLQLELIAQNTPVGNAVSAVIRNQLSEVGVDVQVRSLSPDQFYDQNLIPGRFDLAAFEWTKSASPFAHDRPVFAKPESDDPASNFGRVYIPEIDILYDEGLVTLDADRRTEIANEIDVLAWEHAHHLPLYTDSGAYAVRENLANYGARGLGAYGFDKAGWQQ